MNEQVKKLKQKLIRLAMMETHRKESYNGQTPVSQSIRKSQNLKNICDMTSGQNSFLQKQKAIEQKSQYESISDKKIPDTIQSYHTAHEQAKQKILNQYSSLKKLLTEAREKNETKKSHEKVDQNQNQKKGTLMPTTDKKIQYYNRQLFKESLNLLNKTRVINLAGTRYPVITRVAQQMGFSISKDNEFETGMSNWDIKWTDIGLGAEYIRKMGKGQSVNYFVGISAITRKNLLMQNLYRMKEQFHIEYAFFPQTFQYPQELTQIKKYHRKKLLNKQQSVFIVKPEASCQGRGIYLCDDPDDIENQKSIVQEYVTNPMLINKLKFDLRIYVLLKSVNPLEVYIYKEGLVRFATEEYQKPNKYNMENLCMHLTNYAINKENPKYQFNKTLTNLHQGHKQSLAEFMKTLALTCGSSFASNCWIEMKEIIVKTILACQPQLSYQYRKAQPKNQESSVCFQVLGYDFMILEGGQPILLEVNHSPSYSTETPLDKLVKGYLIKDTLNIVKESKKVINKLNNNNFQFRSKRSKTESASNEEYKRQPNKPQISFKNNKDSQQKMELSSLPTEVIGNYELIYPSKNHFRQVSYERILSYAKNQFFQCNFGQGMKEKSLQKQLQQPQKLPMIKIKNTVNISSFNEKKKRVSSQSIKKSIEGQQMQMRSHFTSAKQSINMNDLKHRYKTENKRYTTELDTIESIVLQEELLYSQKVKSIVENTRRRDTASNNKLLRRIRENESSQSQSPSKRSVIAKNEPQQYQSVSIQKGKEIEGKLPIKNSNSSRYVKEDQQKLHYKSEVPHCKTQICEVIPQAEQKSERIVQAFTKYLNPLTKVEHNRIIKDKRPHAH